MFKLLLAIGGGLVALVLLVAGGVAAAFAAGALKVPRVEEVHNSWGDVTAQQTDIVTSIVLDNPNSVSLGLNNLSLGDRVFLNDIQVGQGQSKGVHLPEGVSTIKIVTAIDNSRIADWWPTHIANGERTTLRIAPYGETHILGWALSVPGPDFTNSFQTDLLAAANSNTPQTLTLVGGYGVTIESRQFHWGATNSKTTNIDGTVMVYNNTPVPIPISRIDFQFVMNSITVGQGSTGSSIVLQPGQDTPVPMHFFITNAKLDEWWPTHVEAGEKTHYQIIVGAVFEPTLPLIGQRTFDIPLANFENDFQTHLLSG